MAAIAVKFATPAVTRAGNSLFINFDGGGQLEFAGGDALQQYIAANAPDVDSVRAMAIANRLASDPLLDTPANWDGRTYTYDPEVAHAPDVVKVT